MSSSVSQNSGHAGTSKAKKSKTKKIWSGIAFGIVLFCALFLLFFGLTQIFESHETHTSREVQTVEAEIMVCEAAAPRDPLFSVEGAEDVEHEIKVTYKNGLADKISYELQAELNSPEAAEHAEATTHATYNNFMGTNASDFSANFMPIGDDYKLNITADIDKLTPTSARIFFIEREQFESLKEFGIDDIKRFIQTAGFHCEQED